MHVFSPIFNFSGPQFLTYNYLSASEWLRKHLPSKLIRNASIGMVSSMLSDIIVNCLRVLKTTKQSLAAKRSVGYIEAARMILSADGWQVSIPLVFYFLFCPLEGSHSLLQNEISNDTIFSLF